MICLANSRKPGGLCVAGIDYNLRRMGVWVRPVTPDGSGAVRAEQSRYADGIDLGVLDVVSVPVTGPSAHNFQTENWQINPSEPWVFRNRVSWKHLSYLESPEERLRPTEAESSGSGSHDRVYLTEASGYGYTLRFIRVEDLRIIVQANGHVRAAFFYLDDYYDLSVTDPVIEADYRARGQGSHTVAEAYLTLSLGEPLAGYCYKLVAAVIDRERAEGGS